MRQFYSKTLTKIALVIGVLLLGTNAKAQTTLAAGDLIFTGFDASVTPVAGGAADSFSFVLLTGITNGTTISFSDRGYFGSSTWQAAVPTEATVTWVSSGTIAAGTEVYIVGLTAYTYNPATTTSTVNGTVTATEGGPTNGLSLSTVGDQIIAFQGGGGSISAGGTTNIAGINYFYSTDTTSAGWNLNTAFGPNSSLMPTGLTGGTSAFYTGAQSGSTSAQAGKFNCNGVPTATVANVRTAVMTIANWSLAVSSLAQPTGCTFLSTGPAITTSGTLSAFASCSGTPSTQQSFIASGNSLTANITVTAPTGYEVSTTSGSGFAASVTLTQSGGNVTNTTIYVRLTSSASGSPNGNISLTSTGATTKTVAVTGTVTPIPFVTAQPTPKTVCAGLNTTFSVTANNVTSYKWQVSTGAAFSDINDGGVYSGTATSILTITGATAAMDTYQYRARLTNGSCTDNSNSATLTVPTALGSSVSTQSNVTTFGGNDGSATISVTGGTTPYFYSWLPSGGTGATANGLSAGTYTVTITDSTPNGLGGCTKTQTVTITQPAGLGASVTSLSAFTGCLGVASSNQSFTVSGSSLTANIIVTAPTGYQVSLSAGSGFANSVSVTPTGGNVSTTTIYARLAATATGTPSGNITVASTGATTQNVAVTGTVITISGTTVVTNISCNGGNNGAITLTPTGGTGPYTYNWGGGITSQNRTGLTAGSYSVTITDTATGCSGTVSGIPVTQPPALVATASAQTNIACRGAATGSATVAATGGTGTYTYLWAPSGGTAATATNLPGGNYTVTVTDANGCTDTESFSITQPAAVLATTAGTVTNVSCNGGGNGTATVIASGGTPNYTYSWAPSGGSSATATGLSAGTYTVTVTDAFGCQATRNFTIDQPAAVLNATFAITNVSCFGGNNGAIDITPAGGTSPYSYLWIGGATTQDRTGLVAGTYRLTITDANNCTYTTPVLTVTQPAASVSGTTLVTNIACRGASTGNINLTPTGGIGPYSVVWNDGTTTEDRSNLPAGVYTATITDSNGCTGSVSPTVNQPAAILNGATTVTNVVCNGGSNGAINLTPSGGTPPYYFDWGGGITTEDRTGLTAGTYTVIITDDLGCTKTVTATVTQPTALVASFGAQTNVSCNGGANGSATVNVTGGTPNYTYTWAPTGGTAATATGLVAGTYTVTVKDANNCQTTQSFTITQPTTLTATTSFTNVLCNGGATGSATVTPSGGTGTYTYVWSPSGGTADTASGLAVGNYSCLITDANGCFITKNFTITQPPVLGATTAQTNANCSSGGVASVTPFGGTVGYTYLWSPGGATTQTVTDLAAGNHSCLITDGNGCTVTKNFVITTTNTLVATTFQTNLLCNGGTTGSAGVIPSGAPGPYTYVWSPSGGNADTATNLAAGNYSVVITASNGCSITKNFTITQPTALVATAGIQNNVSCNGGANGSAAVNVTGGTPGYTYLWAPSGGTGATAVGLPAGTYTVTVKDANLCQTTQSFTITQPAALVASVGSQTNVSCNGGINGSATVAVTGGTGTYTYLWAPSGGTGATASGLIAGTYTVTVKDANLCQTTQSFTITEPTVLTATTSQTNILCNGGATGTASVTAAGGTGPYTYTWAPSGGTAATATGLTAGTYTCTIIDSKGCGIIKTVTLTQPAALVATAGAQTDASCNGGANGTATVVVTGGTAPYGYDWNGTPIGDGTSSVMGLTAGTYTVTVTDANGCTVNQIFTITQPSALTATTSQTNVSCFGANNGSASVVVTGGTGAYTYLWAPSGGTASTATGLAAGTYTVTINDANLCQITRTFTITSTQALSMTSSQTNVSCFGANNGSAAIAVTGGTNTYTYAWSPSGGTAATATGLAPGDYTVTATDGNGCTISNTFTITQPAVLAATTSQTNVLCNGGTTGSASVTVSGGTTAYTYLWSPSGGTASTATGLAAGNYSVLITDAKGCTLTKTFTITQPAAALSATTSQTNILCFGAGSGSATVNATGGTPNYTYAWAPSGGTAATATGLAAGNYTCTITDANGCSITRSFTITQPSAALAATTTQTNILCFGTSTGSASVVATGGTGAYTYAWVPSGGTAATATGLAAGNYTCTITDANGCTVAKTFTITQLPALVINGSSTNITCNGTANGVASVTVSGGTPGYSYSWAPSGGTAATATGLTAGVYVCTVTDANGCTKTRNFTIYEQPAILVTSVKTDVVCPGAATGSATVTVSGGVPNYTYLWAPSGGNSATATGLAAGAYTCTVTDVLGCSIVHSVTISGPEAWSVAISQSNISCFGNNDGAIDLTVSGGTGPYSYAWTPSVSTGSSVSGLGVGNYSVTITDALGCTTVRNFSLSQPEELIATITKTDVTCYGNNDGTALAEITGGTPPYTYSWTAPDGGTPDPANLVSGTYTVVITDDHGCTFTGSITINQPLQTIVSAHPQDVTTDTGGNATFTVNALNATDYQWQYSEDGTNWLDITDGGSNPEYSGATTNSLTLTGLPESYNGYSYRVILKNGVNCMIISNSASLTLENVLVAVNDDFNDTEILEGTGGIAGNVTANDIFNDQPVSNDDIVVTVIDNDGLFGAAIDNNGNLIIPSTATEGTYTITYSICEAANLTNCSTAEAVVVVTGVSGTADFRNLSLSIYPNPATTSVNIKIPDFSDHDNLRLNVFDLNGRLVKECRLTSELQSVEVTGLESGVYIFKIQSDTAEALRRIVVEKRFE